MASAAGFLLDFWLHCLYDCYQLFPLAFADPLSTNNCPDLVLFVRYIVKRDGIDASIGLQFSLRLFQHYQRSGTLHAQLRHVPGVRGTCSAYLHLRDGTVDTCYVEDKQGQRHQISVEALCRLDSEKGPFEWVFQPQTSAPAAPTAPPPNPASSPSQLSDTCIPEIVAPLHEEYLQGWLPAQKQILVNVFKLINGKRTLQEIEAALDYPPLVVEEQVQMLLALQVIAISS